MSLQEIRQKMLELSKLQRDAAQDILKGQVEFEEATPGVQAMILTRILHPDLAEILDRPEEFSGAEMSGGQLDEPSPHANVHALVLQNAMERDDAANALGNMMSVAGHHLEDNFDALHAAVHVMMGIHAQQLWGATIARTGESAARKREGESALKDANSWFMRASRGRVNKLPGGLRGLLRRAASHPSW